jgi:predicted Zn finger-like uncharacterized protein
MAVPIRCPACNAYVDEKSRVSAGVVRCEKCGMRFSLPRTEGQPATREADPELGIHPALAKKYRGQVTPPRGTPEVSRPPVDDKPPHHVVQMPPPEMEQKAPTIELSPSLVEQGAQKVPDREERTRALGPQKSRRGPDEAEKADPLPEIPGYVLVGVVGKGAMGRVYRARADRSGELVAVKTLAPELAARPDFIARFEREAAALKAVNHPGVVSIFDRGSIGDIHFLCMHFVEGESLRRGLGGGPLQPLRALGFARQIVQALGAAHDKKVIHRDLKPENILVTLRAGPDGIEHEALVLVDFGLAGMGEDDPHPNLTKSRMTMGTVNYMAPEQRTDAKRVGPQADLYAAGVILYELLTGDLPLGRFKMPTERPGLAHLPPYIDECLARALDRDPDRRYANAADFDRDLARIETELVAQVSRDTVVGRAAPARIPESGPPTEVASRRPHADPTGEDSARPNTRTDRSEPSSSSSGDSTSGSSSSTGPSRGASSSSRSSSTGSDVSVVEHRRERKTFGPQWITSPPWVKHPHAVWGLLALVVGAGIGLLATPSNDDEPRLTGFPVTPGWRADGAQFISTDDGSPPDVARPILVPLLSSRTAIEARVVAIDADEGFAGVVVRQGSRVVGVGVATDGTCVRIEQGKVTPLESCRASTPTGLTLRCVANGDLVRCTADVGGTRDVELVEGRMASMAMGLICKGARCNFEDVIVDNPSAGIAGGPSPNDDGSER